MIRLAVISGKGGTGKTIITAALSSLLPGTLVLADCDVDAANLGLLLSPTRIQTEPFMGMNAAMIDPDLCTQCGQCYDHCRFSAVNQEHGVYSISQIRCEGCGVCVFVCPADAVSLQPRISGEICTSSTDAGLLAHGRLKPGAGNSGLLVHAVKKAALLQDRNEDLFLIDGPPGIGCPLISTLTGTDAVLVVTEPSMSGLHDLARVVKVARQYTSHITVAINRFDLEETLTSRIEQWCREEGCKVIGKIPFDPEITAMVRNCSPVRHFHTSPGAIAIQELANTLIPEIGGL